MVLQRQSITPNIVTYNALISACARSNFPSSRRRRLRETPERLFPRGAKRPGGSAAEADVLFELQHYIAVASSEKKNMVQCVVPLATHDRGRVLCSNLCRVSQWWVNLYFDHVQRQGLEPDVITYGAVFCNPRVLWV